MSFKYEDEYLPLGKNTGRKQKKPTEQGGVNRRGNKPERLKDDGSGYDTKTNQPF